MQKQKHNRQNKRMPNIYNPSDTSKGNAFIVLDINKDGAPELLTGSVYEQSKFLNCIFTYRDGK